MAASVIVAALLCGPGGAAAESRWIVEGTIESVDEQAKVIEVDGQSLHIGSRARIKLASGGAGTWADVLDRDGEHVSALVHRGYQGADEVLTIVLEDAIPDPS